MKTYFVMHGITNRNKDNHLYDNELKKLGYDETNLSKEQIPSDVDFAQGQIDEPLIEKGKKQAEFIGEQINHLGDAIKIDRIYCSDQIRCKQTAKIIADKIGITDIIVDKRLNARSYGIIAENKMETDKLKHFWRYKTNASTLKTIALFLLAPEKLNAEKKSDFKARVDSFIHDKDILLNNALIVAGSDVWDFIVDENYYYSYYNENESELKRGQIGFINFALEKKNKLLKDKSKNNKNENFYEMDL